MSGLIVAAKGIQKSYRAGAIAVPVLRGLDLLVTQGEFVAIRGPSGCGKTTLLNCLSGLDEIDGGAILFEGEDLVRMSERARTRRRGERMGFVFQSFNLLSVLTAVQNVELPLLFLGWKRTEARRRALEVLGLVGLADRAHHRPGQLSGGQQQRVAIARALANRPAVVWADEPTGNLDTESGTAVLELLARLNRDQGLTLVVVTHSDAIVKASHRVVTMDSGRIVAGRTGT